MAKAEKAVDRAAEESTREAKARRADPNEFPKMLYHRGDNDELMTLIVKDPVDQAQAAKSGWKERP